MRHTHRNVKRKVQEAQRRGRPVSPGKNRIANAPDISQIRQTNHLPKTHRGHPIVHLHPAHPSQPRVPSDASSSQSNLSVLRSNRSPPSPVCPPIPPTWYSTWRLCRRGSNRLEISVKGTGQFFASHRVALSKPTQSGNVFDFLLAIVQIF